MTFPKYEREQGNWCGNKFIFKTPQPIKTFTLLPHEDGKNIRFKLDGIPKNSFVYFHIEYKKGRGFLIIKNHENAKFNPGRNGRAVEYGLKINDKREAVAEFNIPTNSDPTIAYVSILSFDTAETALIELNNVTA